jgi:CRISPR/Cas system-associated endonuclease Cas3-HD
MLLESTMFTHFLEHSIQRHKNKCKNTVSKVLIIHSLGNTSPKITVYMISGFHSAAGEDYKGIMTADW